MISHSASLPPMLDATNRSNVWESDSPVSTVDVCVVGLGYIGLPTAGILARHGYRVLGVDIRSDVVDGINHGRVHSPEPELDQLLQEAIQERRLHASLTPQPADVFILCVPTAANADHSADLTHVRQAAQAVRPHVRPGALIILESTIPPRTTQDVLIKEAVPPGYQVGRDVFVAHCPERVLPGRILVEAVENDRIVGGITPACTAKAQAFYQSFVQGNVLPTTAVTAELAKLVENSFRDVNIAFANEVSLLADQYAVDPWELIALANRHPRVQIHKPGPGVGGHCIGVDPWFLVHAAPQVTPLIRAAREVNQRKPQHVVEQVARLVKPLKDPIIGCLGLTYKADVDDLRESPSLQITEALQARNLGEVLACDPWVDERTFDKFPLVTLETILERCQVLVLLTDHSQFRQVPPKVLQERMVVDTRGFWR